MPKEFLLSNTIVTLYGRMANAVEQSHKKNHRLTPRNFDLGGLNTSNFHDFFFCSLEVFDFEYSPFAPTKMYQPLMSDKH